MKTNSAQLENEFTAELNVLAEYLASHSDHNVRIVGHTDDVGSLEYNKQLSLQRAQAVVDHLMNQGIDIDRLKSIGMGNSQPLEFRATSEARRKIEG